MENADTLIQMAKTPFEFLPYKLRGETSLSSGAIYSALKIAFPDKINHHSMPLIERFIELQVDCNNYCDLGIPATNNISKPFQTSLHFQAAHRLEQTLHTRLTNSEQKFLSLHPNFQKEVKSFITDSMLLARAPKPTSIHDTLTYIETDSAIFEAACIAVAAPEVLINTPFDQTSEVRDYDSLVTKYSYFTGKPDPSDKTQQLVHGLHSSEMVLKIIDDLQGVKEDSILKSPSFVNVFRTESGSSSTKFIKSISKYLSRYRKSARRSNFALSQLLSESLMWLRPFRMSSRQTQAKPLEIYEVEKAFSKDPRQLREWLSNHSLLPEIF